MPDTMMTDSTIIKKLAVAVAAAAAVAVAVVVT